MSFWIDPGASAAGIWQLLQTAIVALGFFELCRDQDDSFFSQVRKLPARLWSNRGILLLSLIGIALLIAREFWIPLIILGPDSWFWFYLQLPQNRGLMQLLMIAVALVAIVDLRRYERVQAVHDPVSFRWFYRFARLVPLFAWFSESELPSLLISGLGFSVESARDSINSLFVAVIAGTLPLSPTYQIDGHWLARIGRGVGRIATALFGGLVVWRWIGEHQTLSLTLFFGTWWRSPSPVAKPIDNLGLVNRLESLDTTSSHQDLVVWLIAVASFIAYLQLRHDQVRASLVVLLFLLGSLALVAWRAVEDWLLLEGFEYFHNADSAVGIRLYYSLRYFLFCGVVAGYLAYRRGASRGEKALGIRSELIPDSALARGVVLVVAVDYLFSGLAFVWRTRPEKDLLGSIQFLLSVMVIPSLWWGRFKLAGLIRWLVSSHGGRWALGGLLLLGLIAATEDREWWLQIFRPAMLFFSNLLYGVLVDPARLGLLMLAAFIVRQSNPRVAYAAPARQRLETNYTFSPVAFVVSLLSFSLLMPAAVLLIWRYHLDSLFEIKPWGIP